MYTHAAPAARGSGHHNFCGFGVMLGGVSLRFALRARGAPRVRAAHASWFGSRVASQEPQPAIGEARRRGVQRQVASIWAAGIWVAGICSPRSNVAMGSSGAERVEETHLKSCPRKPPSLLSARLYQGRISLIRSGPHLRVVSGHISLIKPVSGTF